jgi:hypothetical protein
MDDDEIDEGPREASRAREQADKPVFESETGVVRGASSARERSMMQQHIEKATAPKDRSAHVLKKKRATIHEDSDSDPGDDDEPMKYPEREGIIDEFNSPGYVALAFPHLFPYDIGDVTQERLGETVALKDDYRHLMRYCDSRGEYRSQSSDEDENAHRGFPQRPRC